VRCVAHRWVSAIVSGEAPCNVLHRSDVGRALDQEKALVASGGCLLNPVRLKLPIVGKGSPVEVKRNNVRSKKVFLLSALPVEFVERNKDAMPSLVLLLQAKCEVRKRARIVAAFGGLFLSGEFVKAFLRFGGFRKRSKLHHRFCIAANKVDEAF